MLYRLNPWEIVKEHFATFYDYSNGMKLCKYEIVLQFIIAVCLAVLHVIYFKIDSTTVGIVVSAASIVAGLLLNLMVLIYSLIISKVNGVQVKSSNEASDVDNSVSKSEIDDFKGVGKETLSNIAFSILACIVLVFSALLTLSDNFVIYSVGHFFVIFSAILLGITILIVLLRFYRLIINNVKSM